MLRTLLRLERRWLPPEEIRLMYHRRVCQYLAEKVACHEIGNGLNELWWIDADYLI